MARRTLPLSAAMFALALVTLVSTSGLASPWFHGTQGSTGLKGRAFGLARGATRSAAFLTAGGVARATSPAAAASVPDGSGGSYIAWSSVRDGITDVYLQRYTSSGDVAAGWPAAGLPVCTAGGDQLEGVILPDGSNGVIVGWLDFRATPLNPYSPTADLYAQRVNSSGTPQWTANGVHFVTGVNYSNNIDAVPDGAGGMFLTWAMGTPRDIYTLKITGTGAIASGWSPSGQVVCSDVADQYDAKATSDGSGGCFVTWEDARDTYPEIYAQRLNSAGAAQWTTDGLRVDTALYGGTMPTICSDNSGGAIIGWVESSDILGQRLNASGAAQWTAAGVNLGTMTGDVQDLYAIADGSGGAYLAWDGGSPSMEILAQRVNSGGVAQWTASGVVLASTSSYRQVEDLQAEIGGGLTAVWTDYRISPYGADIYAQRVNAAGTIQWGVNGLAICAAGGDQSGPVVAPDGAGGAVVAWVDSRSLDPEIYAQRVNTAGSIQLATDGKAVVSDPGSQQGAFTVTDGGSGMWVVWNEKVSGSYDIHTKHLDSAGQAVGGTITVCAASGHQTLSDAISDNSGGVIVAWADARSGTSDIYAQRLNASGTAQWTANGQAVCTAGGEKYGARIASDGAGGAILTWTDSRAGNSDVYAQRIASNGAVLWTVNGVSVCTDPSVQEGPVVASAQSNGAIIAWGDLRSIVLEPGIYAQRLDGAGAPQWTADGLWIANVPFSSSCVGAVSDGVNGAVVLVETPIIDYYGTGGWDRTVHRLQRVDASGAQWWSGGGVLVADATGMRGHASLVPDGTGGAFVAWSDGRDGVYDVYAQRVDGGGAHWAGTAGQSICLATSWQWVTGLVAGAGNSAVVAWTDERNGFADVYAQKLNNLAAGQWTANGVAVVSASRGQYGATLCLDGSSNTHIAWTDYRSGTERLIYAQTLNNVGAPQWGADGVTSTLFSLVGASSDGKSVLLCWSTSLGSSATVYRRTDLGDWTSLGQALADGTGRLVFEDREVLPGVRYAYRIGVSQDGGEIFSSEVWVDVPSSLALGIEGARPNPAAGDLTVALSLATRETARLELVDITGRRVLQRDLTTLGPGRHVLRLDGPAPAGGLYFLRLTQGGRTVTGRVVFLR